MLALGCGAFQDGAHRTPVAPKNRSADMSIGIHMRVHGDVVYGIGRERRRIASWRSIIRYEGHNWRGDRVSSLETKQ